MPSSQGYQKVASEPVEPEPVAAKLAAEMSGIQQVVTGNPAGKIPATNSQQRLVLADSDSVASSQDEGDPEAPPGLPGDDDDSGVSSVGGMRSVTGKAWFTVSVLCFVNLINYMDRFTIAGVLTDIQSYFSIGDDEGGLLQTAFVLSYMICAPLFGYLGDRYSRKWIMALGVFLWSTTTLLGSFMHQFGWFITFRALVGIGEASYSTIAPTIISDLFVGDTRSKMLAMFYFAIPVGSGFGYIVGSETAKFFGSWAYALRVTPLLGIIAVVLIAMLEDPERGQSEGSHQMEVTSYREDIKAIVRNPSFMLSTAGFTCVAFVAGALAWWGPKFIYLGLVSQPGNENITLNDVSFTFGAITMTTGIIGVPLGSYLSQRFNRKYPRADAYICALGLILSAPLLAGGMLMVTANTTLAYVLVFFGELALNLNWAIVADILLYVVVPTRRSTAEAFQILISHAFGDAGSPYFVGLISEAIKRLLRLTAASAALVFPADLTSYSQLAENATTTTTTFAPVAEDSPAIQFRALQYALFSTSFVEIIGGVFFLLTAMYILRDRRNVERAVAGCELELSESSSGSESHDQTLTQDSHSHNHAHHHASHSHPHSHRHQQRCARFPSEVAARSS
ncbi:protein spinster isoform X1 [Toxorhynchites rutilus septentrionalis]|uniref:protein spinster isoform X1 n=1 Tax=Toxorhynchites rutilus septentrionalis TaxID=329112 RepID=UPI002478AECD|nr:protein spinster isoform X1 [Toxorhynchites rutilus septentrionalis]